MTRAGNASIQVVMFSSYHADCIEHHNGYSERAHDIIVCCCRWWGGGRDCSGCERLKIVGHASVDD